jgi:hypothetical protein
MGEKRERSKKTEAILIRLTLHDARKKPEKMQTSKVVPFPTQTFITQRSSAPCCLVASSVRNYSAAPEHQ